MPLRQSKKPKMSSTTPNGKATILMQRITPTIIKMIPIPAVMSLPAKEKTKPTKNQTNLKGKEMSSNSKVNISTLLRKLNNHYNDSIA